MPIYEYECEKCERMFEYMEPMSSTRDADKKKKVCPECGGKLKRKIGNVFGGLGDCGGFSIKPRSGG